MARLVRVELELPALVVLPVLLGQLVPAEYMGQMPAWMVLQVFRMPAIPRMGEAIRVVTYSAWPSRCAYTIPAALPCVRAHPVRRSALT